MKPNDNLEEMIRQKLSFSASDKLHNNLLNDVLNSQEKFTKTHSTVRQSNIRRIIMRSPVTKLAAIILICTSVGAAAFVGVKVRKLYFAGREPDGTYVFQTEPEIVDAGDGQTKGHMRMVISNDVDDVEQKIKDLEEVELLRRQDTNRLLLSVIETEVNGKLQPRTFKFKYLLADGREITIGEHDPDTKDLDKSLTEAQKEEVMNLMRADEFEDLENEEKEVMGRVFVFGRMKFILSDGTEVIKSIGRPKANQ
jgi:hypothetical protein